MPALPFTLPHAAEAASIASFASIPFVACIVSVGLLATAVMDLSLYALSRLGWPAPDFSLVGRWVGHMARGRFAHASIAQAAAVRHERALGWFVHYATGVVFAALFAAVAGEGWWRHPTPGLAVAFGLATVAAPFFVMQPAMGAGFAASRTPAPYRNRLRSAVNHLLFGLGLYAAATLVAGLAHR